MLNGYVLTILSGAKITLLVSALAMLAGLLFGGLGAVAETAKTPFKFFIHAWNAIIRGLPDIFIILACYYLVAQVLSSLLGHYVNINPLTSGIISLALIVSAYSSQIFIAAMHAIPKGEIHAAQALGLSKWTTLECIILPQLWQHAMPGIINLWLVILKDSSIVSLIGLHDIMNAAHVAASESFKPFTYYSIAAALYLALTILTHVIANQLGYKFNTGADYATATDAK